MHTCPITTSTIQKFSDIFLRRRNLPAANDAADDGHADEVDGNNGVIKEGETQEMLLKEFGEATTNQAKSRDGL